MLASGADIAETQLDCAVCIVGGGMAGLSMALALKGSGIDTLVVEAGHERLDEAEQSFYAGSVVDPSHANPQFYRQRRLGGTGGIWGGRCVPYDPIDFETRDFVPHSGWPISYAEVSRHYERAHEILELGAFEYRVDEAFKGDGRRPKDMIAGFSDPHVHTDRLERFSPPTNVWKRHRRAFREARDVRLLSRVALVRLATDADRRSVEYAECVRPDGRPLRIRARQFVLAVGGLETFRLLKHSGLGDRSGMLGRGYMCHIESRLGTLRLAADRPVMFGFERTRDDVYSRRRLTLSESRQRELHVMNASVRLHHLPVFDPAHGDAVLSSMYLAKSFLLPEYARNFAIEETGREAARFTGLDLLNAAGQKERDLRFWMGHARNMALGSPALLAFGADWMHRRYLRRRRLPHVALKNRGGIYPLHYYGEQAPNFDSRIRLGEERDRFGVPRLVVDWRANELDRRTLLATFHEIKRAIEASGCGTVDLAENAPFLPVGGHHIGTARMSADPGQGVVDGDGRVHHVANFYVAGSATFPTSGQANPTLTVVAMALRLAEHLKERALNELAG